MKGQFRWESLVKIDTSYGAKAISVLLDNAHALFDSHKPNGASTVRVNVNVDALE
jgi:primosomal protein N' (replication factor Y)